MRSELSKLSVLAVFVFHSGAALSQSGEQKRIITKAPPKEHSRYLTNAEVRTMAVPNRSNVGRLRTAPGYIAPEPSTSNYAIAPSSLAEHTGSVLPIR